jgi:hypothetical protein
MTLAALCAECVQSQSAGDSTSTNQAVASPQTVAYCDLFEHSEEFKNQMVRVKAIYQTDFEKSLISSAACPLPFPLMTWVKFDGRWESRTTRKVRKIVSNVKWGVPFDVVFVGKIKTGGRYGHMDMYPLEIEVYKVEAATAPKDSMPHSSPDLTL